MSGGAFSSFFGCATCARGYEGDLRRVSAVNEARRPFAAQIQSGRETVMRNAFVTMAGAWLAMAMGACAATEPVESDETPDVGVNAEALEFGCLFAAADGTAELGPEAPNGREILTREPYDTSVAQSYGSFGCSGFVADFTNPNGYNINSILVAGAGWVKDIADVNVYGNSTLCGGLTLEADVYGLRNGAWATIDSFSINGDFLPNDAEDGTDRCHLGREIVQPGIYEAVRVAARVSNSVTTYPFRAHVH
jgi:hypothetical protein